MSDEGAHGELEYYKLQLDELAGENLRRDYALSGLHHELKQRQQAFALLSELQQSIGAEQEISSIFETTIAAINATLGMDRSVVLVPDESGDRFRVSQWVGFREEALGRLATIALELPPQLTDRGGVLLVNRATSPTPIIEQIREAFGIPFFIAVPVAGEGAPIGVLLSGRLKEVRPLYPPLHQGDVDTFQSIAGLISASIRNRRVAVLEQMDRLKTDFFANISHEFRTPITLTIGPIEQLQGGRYGPLPERALEQLTIVRRNQERLLGLVNQILDLARLEAGSMELKAVRVTDVNELVRQRTEVFRAIAQERSVDLRLSLDPRAAHADLYLDRDKFEKLLFNLMSNAVKFTKHGWIEVATGVADSAFRLTVTDTGVGIKADQLPHIFDRFRQADGSESREYAGSGIGLALVKEIAKVHGGDVQAFSQFGRGTSLVITIPFGREHLSPSSIVDIEQESADSIVAPTIVREGATDTEGAGALNAVTAAQFAPNKPTIVYAEDNPDLRRHMHDLLAEEFNLFLAVDGKDGFEAAMQYEPDLIITDQMMPNVGGRGFLKAVREDPKLAHTPVIFLTARVGTEARIESLDSGADDYLTKPFHEGELLARVRNLIRARRQERELADLNHRLEAKIDEQLGELLRSGQLRRFLPPTLVSSLLDGSLDAESQFERRRITVLFAQVGGFELLGEFLEPEESSELVNESLRALTGVAVAELGTIDVATPQAITVLFGAPEPLAAGEQARAAARAALKMRATIDELATGWRRHGLGAEPALRASFATGYATVGVYGSELMRSYTAVGTPVTVAVKLVEQAGPGEILMAGESRALLEERAMAATRGSYSLAGVRKPIEVFELLSLRGDEIDASQPKGSATSFLPK